MEFTWHEEKRLRNLTKHGLGFNQAQNVFSGSIFTFQDTRFEYGEQRFVTIGLLKDVVVIVHTETDKEVV